jgi:hypothetical protein
LALALVVVLSLVAQACASEDAASATAASTPSASTTVTAAATPLATAPAVPTPSAQPTPTPTPSPTPSPTLTPAGVSPSDPELWVNIQMSIEAQELAVSASGQSPILISTTSSGRIPAAGEPATVVTGLASVTQHAVDDAGCAWTRTFTKPDLEMTVFDSGDSSVLVGVDGPDWYYMVQCPGNPPPPPLRSPAFGEEGIRLFLQTVFSNEREADGVRLPTSPYAGGAGCVKRSALIRRSSGFADVTVSVFVYQANVPGGCVLPISP